MTVGEFEDCPEVSGVLAEGWSCVVLPEYLVGYTLVAAIGSLEGRHAVLFIAEHGQELDHRPREGSPELIGWFHVRRSEPVTDCRSLIANLRHAVAVLAKNNLIPVSAIPPPLAEA